LQEEKTKTATFAALEVNHMVEKHLLQPFKFF